MVPGRGFEPRFCAPEAHVLPLDDPGAEETHDVADNSRIEQRSQRGYRQKVLRKYRRTFCCLWEFTFVRILVR